MIGQTISHYKITAKLGAGGMGEVYLAEDLQLGRKVAVKFLSAEKSSDEESRQRFIHEARAQAMLNHPNIATFYEVSEANGRAFIVMEYIEGKSLPEIIHDESLSLTEAYDITIQIAEGLQAAHEKGVVHRDIKPENIMVTPKGHVKITDFGLARWKGATTLTQSGTRMGTAYYMSPEQAEGKKLDHRSDIFSLGIVLYELVTGHKPFEGEHEAAITYSIVHDMPRPLARYEANVSVSTEQIVSKCLAKRREERYQSCADLVADLRLEMRASEPGTASSPRRMKQPNRRGMAVAAIVFVILAVLAFVLKPWEIVIQPTEEAAAGRKMLAVLPFENLGSEDQEYFADGITEEITTHVARISALGVISRTSAIKYKGTDKSLPEIGTELGVDYVLEGTIRWDDSGPERRVRINPQLIRVSDDTHVWTDTYDRVLEQIFAVQTEIAEQVAIALDVTLLQPERELVSTQPTENIEAYGYYLRGLQYRDFTLEDFRAAEEMFLRATELDSSFALAYARLSMAHGRIYWWYYDHTPERARRAKEAVDRALDLAPHLPEVHLALSAYYYRIEEDNDRALAELSIALAGQPNDAEALYRRAVILQRQGKHREALHDLEEAVRLAPHDPIYMVALGHLNSVLRRYAAADALFDRALTIDPDRVGTHLARCLFYISLGDIEAARKAAHRAAPGEHSKWVQVVLAQLDLTAGRLEDGLARLTSADGSPVTGTGDSTDYYLFKAEIYKHMSDTTRTLICADSARTILQRILTGDLKTWEEAINRKQMARALVLLGRHEEAIREAETAVRMLPVSKDAVDGWELVLELAYIYTAVGEYDQAVDQLERVLSNPNYYSVEFLKINPDFVKLHGHPRFEALIEKGHTVF